MQQHLSVLSALSALSVSGSKCIHAAGIIYIQEILKNVRPGVK